MTHLKDFTEFCNSDSSISHLALSSFAAAADLPLWSLSLRSITPFSLGLSLILMTIFLLCLHHKHTSTVSECLQLINLLKANILTASYFIHVIRVATIWKNIMGRKREGKLHTFSPRFSKHFIGIPIFLKWYENRNYFLTNSFISN